MLLCCSLTFFNNGQHETMPLCLTSQSVKNAGNHSASKGDKKDERKPILIAS